jgi:hypothetical protein
MGSPASWVVVGRYNGGTSNNATVLDHILAQTGTARTSVRAVGLDTPGPASADGIISSKGATIGSAASTLLGAALPAGACRSPWCCLPGPLSRATTQARQGDRMEPVAGHSAGLWQTRP